MFFSRRQSTNGLVKLPCEETETILIIPNDTTKYVKGKKGVKKVTKFLK